MRLTSDAGIKVSAYVLEEDIFRLSVGSDAVFHAEGDIRTPISLNVDHIDKATTTVLTYPHLASEFGGEIAVRRAPDTGDLVPEQGIYRITLTPTEENEEIHAPNVLRGTIFVETPPRSMAGRLAAFALAALIRESNF